MKPKRNSLQTFVHLLTALFFSVTCVQAQSLFIDFNSLTQDGGPHNQDGYQSYEAGHEVEEDFVTQNFSAFGTTVSVTPAWPETFDNRVMQMIDRGAGNDANWQGDKVDLLTDWLGIDTRVGNGGNGDWDGEFDLPTPMTLTLSGLPPETYGWRSYHHDTENVHAPFVMEISTDGGVVFADVPGPGPDGEFDMSNSTGGGNPPADTIYDGFDEPDPADLPSTVEFEFTAVAGKDVVLRFTPLSHTAVHTQLVGINGLEITIPTDPVDSDNDGMLDTWESVNGLVVGTDDSQLDPDNDGSLNIEEFTRLTDPQKADTDGDGYLDGVETKTGTWVSASDTGTDPKVADADGDGLLDGIENPDLPHTGPGQPGTSPFLADTDSDTYSDSAELGFGTDPTDPNSVPGFGQFLTAYWPLDSIRGENPLTTPDESGNDYHMELMNMDQGNKVSDGGHQAMSFDNFEETMLSRVNSPGDALPIVQHDQFTISLWTKIDGVGQNDLRVFSEGSTVNGNPLFNLGTDRTGGSGVLDLFLRNGGGPDHQFSIGEPFDDTWHHLAFTADRNAESMKFYIDGVLDRDDWAYFDVMNPGTDTTTIGGILRADPSHWVTGLIDDVALWSTVLTEEMIAALAEGVSPPDLGGGPPAFAVTEITRDAAANEVTVTWNSKAGASYTVFFSDDFLIWGDLDDSVPGEADTTSFTDDTIPPGTRQRYYRIQRN